ncbi:MAG: enoyl-CoA hydratase/isomerase family protein [Solirubrobacterales bacterium]
MSIDYHFGDAVAEIVLNRPDRLNAIDAVHFDALNQALKQAVDDHARVLLISGTGRSFCAGRDIGEINPLNEDPADTLRTTFNALVMKMAALPMPSVAAVQGACLGGGAGIALACDIVVAAEDAKFASPFGRLGSVPDSGFHWFLTTRLGPALAKDIVLTGRELTGLQAASLGLIARSVPADELAERAREIAQSIAVGPTRAFSLACQIIDRAADGASLADVLAAEATAQAVAFATADLREGIAAFHGRRSPIFQGV